MLNRVRFWFEVNLGVRLCDLLLRAKALGVSVAGLPRDLVAAELSPPAR